MKIITATVVLLLAGIYAMSQDETALSAQQGRLVTNNIRRMLDNAMQLIVDRGMDPLHFEELAHEIDFRLGKLVGSHKGLTCTGLSGGQFVELRWIILTSRLRFVLEWEEIKCVLKSAEIEASLLNRKFRAETSGNVQINKLSLAGNLRILVRPIGGHGVGSCKMNFSAKLSSNVTVTVQDKNLSDAVNGKIEKWDEVLHEKQVAIGDKICDMIKKAMG